MMDKQRRGRLWVVLLLGLLVVILVVILRACEPRVWDTGLRLAVPR